MSDNQNTVKPLHLSTYDRGGAAVASLRLHHEFLRQGLPSTYLVGHKTTQLETVEVATDVMGSIEQKWFQRVYKKNFILDKQARRTGAIKWSDNRRWHTLPLRLNQSNANIIHLNWLGDGLLPIGMMRFINKPMVWTMHDSWAYTGGCHVPLDCHRYQTACGQCPQLQSDNHLDRSHDSYKLKQSTWHRLNLIVVCPSEWLAERFRQSDMFKSHRIEVIPNGLDLAQFKVHAKNDARRQLHVDPDRKYILFGAVSINDRNKGGDLLAHALIHLQLQDNVTILLLGKEQDEFVFPDSIGVKRLGYISDQTQLNHIYAASDVCVVPSRQENLNNTIMEALASGTPAVAFDVGGNRELIAHLKHGYLAQPYQPEELAYGISWCINNTEKIVDNARNYVEANYDIHKIATRYWDLYQQILS
ncbi:MAG: glycosyltransferase [Chloroflexota bacterium]